MFYIRDQGKNVNTVNTENNDKNWIKIVLHQYHHIFYFVCDSLFYRNCTSHRDVLKIQGHNMIGQILILSRSFQSVVKVLLHSLFPNSTWCADIISSSYNHSTFQRITEEQKALYAVFQVGCLCSDLKSKLKPS